ncbi:unnamed protein product [Lepeophtheirus salmonis]|uniref:(salmon louse) hypothetical protein n=1 Tax=Lepeophtheirus salmonis TaxID=72036 RepID=A0A7R8CN56_LEPSM|nr:unnamed protein product [Lepeophtheirus salmonis]CAF2871445.1 unnamed protein product [Lepeophtheirus salmonis]
MLPSKKRQISESAIRKTGIVKTIICQHLNSFLESSEDLRNGQILYVYITCGNYIAMKSSRKLKEICESRYWMSKGFLFNFPLKGIVLRIYKKIKKLSDKNMMARFSDECNKPFLWSPNAFEPINPSSYTSDISFSKCLQNNSKYL